MAGEEYSYVSSTLMKQVFELGGRVEGLIPELVEAKDAGENRRNHKPDSHPVNHTRSGGPKTGKFYCGVLGPRKSRGGFGSNSTDFRFISARRTALIVQKPKATSHILSPISSIGDLTHERVPCDRGIPIPNYRRFEFRDPFGNRVEFLKRKH